MRLRLLSRCSHAVRSPRTLSLFAAGQHRPPLPLWSLRRSFSTLDEKVTAEEEDHPLVVPEENAKTPPVVDEYMRTIASQTGLAPKDVVETLRFEEQLSLVSACLDGGSMKRAELMHDRLWDSYPTLYKDNVDVHLHNAFLKAFTQAKDRPRMKSALAWLQKMKRTHVAPNITSYLWLIKGALREDDGDLSMVLISELKKRHLNLDHLLLHPQLDKAALRKLKRVFLARHMAVPPCLAERLAAGDSPGDQQPSAAPPEPVRVETPRSTSDLLPVDAPGIQYVKKSLAALHENAPDLYHLQERLEMDAYQLGLEQLKEETQAQQKRDGVANIAPVRDLLQGWHAKLTTRIKHDQEEFAKSAPHAKHIDMIKDPISAFIALLPAEKMAMIVLMQILRSHAEIDQDRVGVQGAAKLVNVVLNIADAIEHEYHSQMAVKHQRRHVLQHIQSDKRTKYATLLLKHEARQARAELERQRQKEETHAGANEWVVDWPSAIKAKIGSRLLYLLMSDAKIEDPVTKSAIPLLHHELRYEKGIRHGVLVFNSVFSEKLAKNELQTVMSPRFLPMLVPPRAWLTWNSGGYLTQRCITLLRWVAENIGLTVVLAPCVRIKGNPDQKRYLIEADRSGKISEVLSALDVLGSTRWRIHEKMFSIIREAWNGEQEWPSIPAVVKRQEKKEMPDVSHLPPQQASVALKKWRQEEHKRAVEMANHHSQRCDANYKLEIAQSFRDRALYFPHDLDFRGRAYPIPTHLNHIGNDLSRALLCFDDAKPLGQRGLFWLKVHVANLYGNSKANFDERAAFVDEHMASIRASIATPLEGDQWWRHADDPWQCLRACYELCEALDSGHPESYLSRIPIAMDGSCNGLQHYAALAGDVLGAEAVNLISSDRPRDVYSKVAEKVIEMVKAEAEQGDGLAQKILPHVDRKLVKQTVMTSVYGVTFMGAKEQVIKRLKERDLYLGDDHLAVVLYATRKIFAALGEVFSGARQLQDWLTATAIQICRAYPDPKAADRIQTKGLVAAPATSLQRRSRTQAPMTPVVWTSPLGLPIVQPYRRAIRRSVSTPFQQMTILQSSDLSPVNVSKQRAAFPPNFIHSLDASHMLMTALQAAKENITFASVHDSFWTHACEVDRLNNVLRNQFVKLHQEPIMEKVRREMEERYAGFLSTQMEPVEKVDPATGEVIAVSYRSVVKPLTFAPLPKRGSFSVESVKESAYFFS